MRKNLIYKQEDFDDCNRLINKVFVSKNNIPHKVFTDDYWNFLFEEFDWTMSEEFWNTVKKITKITGDTYILTAVLDPNPEDYYFKEFGYFNWAKVPLEFDGEQYCQLIEYAPEYSDADSILYNSNTIVWTAPSLQWGIWGDRNYGVCVIGFKRGVHIETILKVIDTWKSVEKAIEIWITPNFSRRKVPKEFKDIMVGNYK